MHSMRWPAALILFVTSFAASAADDAAVEQVRKAEQAFAATMAARDYEAFKTHIAEDAVFFDGDKPTRGRAAVAASWKPFFERPDAPFSWQPETVVVLDSGDLAHSSGPVLDPKGKRVATFNSVWRRGSDGVWRVVFDKGCRVCECAAPQKQ